MTVSTSIRWPTAATPPPVPLRATIARVVFDHAVRRVPVRVSYPDGRVLGAGSPASPELKVVRPAAFFARLGRDAKIGFGEAYMAGDWRAGPGTDLADLLTPFASRLTTLIPPALQRLRVLVDRRVPRDQENTLDGSRSNIAAHYDLSNDLFAAFLDPTMTYSSAWFDKSEPVETATRLEEAQLRKIDGILDLAGVQADTRVLEIGSGWGSLAIRAAQRGARVTTITLSREQMRLARERARRDTSGDELLDCKEGQMHIPDNYLGPATCAVMAIAVAPAWIVSAKKVAKDLPKEKIPLLGIGAAFSFLIMMLNVPVPGGTTAHAVGGPLLAVLGPYAACLSISTALLIQALVFGDGGILSFGANSFNMAFVIPFLGYFVYKFAKDRVKSRRGP